MKINPIAKVCEKTLIVEVTETSHGHRVYGHHFQEHFNYFRVWVWLTFRENLLSSFCSANRLQSTLNNGKSVEGFTLPSPALDLHFVPIYLMHSHSLQAAVMKLWLWGGCGSGEFIVPLANMNFKSSSVHAMLCSALYFLCKQLSFFSFSSTLERFTLMKSPTGVQRKPRSYLDGRTKNHRIIKVGKYP